jgi:hypothetical protein
LIESQSRISSLLIVIDLCFTDLERLELVRKQRELAAEKRKAEQAAAEAAAAGRVLFSFSNAFMWLHAHLLRSQQASAESADALSCGCAGLRVLVFLGTTKTRQTLRGRLL